MQGQRNASQIRTFEPALRDGKPVPARTPMTLRLVAKRQQGDRGENGDAHWLNPPGLRRC
jgi:hypothetical protein